MTEAAWIHLLLEQSLLFSAAVTLLALLRPLLRRLLDAGAVYLAWLLVPLLMLSPWMPSLLQGQVLPVPVQSLAQTFPSWMKPASAAVDTTAPPTPSRHGTADATALPGIEPQRLAAGLWTMGAAALLVLLTWRQRRFSLRLKRSGAQWVAPAGESPALLGLWRSSLVLPQDFEQRFTPWEQALILDHEAVHARRHDNVWNLLAAGLLVLQWFNPLAWWALRRMRQDQELACDAAVLNRQTLPDSGEEPLVKTYVNALLKSHPKRGLPVLSTGWAHQHPLLERVKGLRLHRRPVWQRQLGRGAALSLCLGVTVLAKAAQPSSAVEAAQATERLMGYLVQQEQALGSKPLAVLVQLNSQQGQSAWQQREFAAVYSYTPPDNAYRQLNMSIPMGSWCLLVHLQGFPDGTVRSQGELMDKACTKSLTQLQDIRLGQLPTNLQAVLPDVPGQALQAQVSVSLENPRSERFIRAFQRQVENMSAEQRAQMAEWTARSNKELEQYQALDKAWRRARGEQP